MQQHREETKTCILEAAQKLFASNGYDATGVAEICATAQVSKGAFYHHFPSKQSVFLTLLNEWLAMIDNQLAPLLNTAVSVPENLVKAAGILSLVFESASGQLPMFLEFWRASSHDARIWETTVGPIRRYQDQFTGIIQSGIDQGSIKVVNPNTAARVIIALALGMILQGVIDPQGAAWSDVTQEGYQLLFEGLSR